MPVNIILLSEKLEITFVHKINFETNDSNDIMKSLFANIKVCKYLVSKEDESINSNSAYTERFDLKSFIIDAKLIGYETNISSLYGLIFMVM